MGESDCRIMCFKRIPGFDYIFFLKVSEDCYSAYSCMGINIRKKVTERFINGVNDLSSLGPITFSDIFKDHEKHKNEWKLYYQVK